MRQTDGKLLVVGSAYDGASAKLAIVRLNADGTLDGGFGQAGKVIAAVDGWQDLNATDAVLQADGKLVAAGYVFNNGDIESALLRYNPEGTLDASFGAGGVVSTPVGAGNGVLGALVQQADGKLVAGGSASNGSDADFALVRYRIASPCGNGTIDPGEGCDDGNLLNGDGCDVNCKMTGCGNGILTPGEQCDDGDLVSGDGCDANCRPTGCGNGIVTAGEQCDGGFTGPAGCCLSDCTLQESGTACADDGEACTSDLCDALGHCAHTVPVVAGCYPASRGPP